ncbi:hypothetical protein RR48_10823 [Papilio machaon]|uniref:Uncharacterized protein n=1 Tax=Papilio machaon TaxID=76193 RepID=A0A194R808_PAPMA|nr:hypothetical protein RR48_10823 [Papilio machaon]
MTCLIDKYVFNNPTSPRLGPTLEPPRFNPGHSFVHGRERCDKRDGVRLPAGAESQVSCRGLGRLTKYSLLISSPVLRRRCACNGPRPARHVASRRVSYVIISSQ